MTQPNNGCAAGCGTLLFLMALGFVLAYWPVVLALVLGCTLVYALAVPGHKHRQRQFKALVEVPDRLVRHDPCRAQEGFGVIQSITLAGDLFTPRLDTRFSHDSAVMGGKPCICGLTHHGGHGRGVDHQWQQP